MSRPLPAGAAASALAWLAERAVDRGYDVPHLEGISLGGCAEAHGSDRVGAMRRSAHAHSDPRDPLVGWLCFKADRPEVIESATGLPTVLARHEYAHLLAPGDHGHGRAWRRAVIALGAPAEAERYAAASARRRARRENAIYFVAGLPATREEYLAATRRAR